MRKKGWKKKESRMSFISMVVLSYSSKTKYILGHGEFKMSYAIDLYGQMNTTKINKKKKEK